MITFYNYSKEIRDRVIFLYNSFPIGNLYTKDKCIDDKQQVTLVDNEIKITIWQKRIYDNIKPYRTQCEGDVYVILTINGEQMEYEKRIFDDIISWHFPERPYRLIVPSNLLSNEIIKGFTVKIIMGNLPTVSIGTLQYIYYTDLDGGEILLQNFPEIINEIKPE
jgi:hypothetical protein